MAFKTFIAGVNATAADINTYLMKQVVIVCTSTTRPASPTVGMTIFETDTLKLLIYDGSTWNEVVRYGARTGYAPSWTTDGTAPSIGNGTLIGRYKQTGKDLDLQITLQSGSTSTYGTSTYRLSLPPGMVAAAGGAILPAVASIGTDYPLIAIINGGASTFTFRTCSGNAIVTNTVPAGFATGSSIILSGRIEIA